MKINNLKQLRLQHLNYFAQCMRTDKVPIVQHRIKVQFGFRHFPDSWIDNRIKRFASIHRKYRLHHEPLYCLSIPGSLCLAHLTPQSSQPYGNPSCSCRWWWLTAGSTCQRWYLVRTVHTPIWGTGACLEWKKPQACQTGHFNIDECWSADLLQAPPPLFGKRIHSCLPVSRCRWRFWRRTRRSRSWPPCSCWWGWRTPQSPSPQSCCAPVWSLDKKKWEFTHQIKSWEFQRLHMDEMWVLLLAVHVSSVIINSGLYSGRNLQMKPRLFSTLLQLIAMLGLLVHLPLLRGASSHHQHG